MRLFRSPRTVEWHLPKVFTKLEIHARHERVAELRVRAGPGLTSRREKPLEDAPLA